MSASNLREKGISMQETARNPHFMSWLGRAHKHLRDWLLWYVAGVILAGWGLGYIGQAAIMPDSTRLSSWITVAVFLMIYPMMVTIRLDFLAKAARNARALSLVLAYNFLWAPPVGYALAKLFLPEAELALGFLLVMVVPCSSMSIGYTGLAEGNVELATISVAASFVMALLAVPLWMRWLGSGLGAVPMDLIVQAILTVLLLPMVLGYLTRAVLLRRLGELRFQRYVPGFHLVTQVSMLTVIFLIFLVKAPLLVEKWTMMVWLSVPNVLFVVATLALITAVDRWLGFGYADHMGMVFASTGKNNGTAVALATAAFSPMVAIPAATLPIFQIVFLAGYLKMGGWLRRYYHRGGAEDPCEAPR